MEFSQKQPTERAFITRLGVSQWVCEHLLRRFTTRCTRQSLVGLVLILPIEAGVILGAADPPSQVTPSQVLPSQVKGEDPVVLRPDDKSATADEAMINELMRLRKKAGGGVLRGTVLDGEQAEGEFRQAVGATLVRPEEGQRALLNGANPNENSSSGRSSNGTTSNRTDFPKNSERPGVIDSASRPVGECQLTPPPTAERMVRRLRDQASGLDRIANALELVRQYEHADSLRSTAQELRLVARDWDFVQVQQPGVRPDESRLTPVRSPDPIPQVELPTAP